MFRKTMFLAACLMLANPLSALTEAGNEAFRKLTEAMRAEVEQATKEEAAGKRERHPDAMTLKKSILQLEAAAQAKDIYFEQTLNTHAGFFISEEVLLATQALKAELAAERAAAIEAEIAEMDALIGRIGELVKTAKEPSEMDEAIAGIAKMPRSSGASQNDPKWREASQRIESSRHFVTQWQDYLAAMKRGDRRAAGQFLSSIAQYGYQAPFIARSEVLEMIEALQEKPAAKQEGAGLNPVERRILEIGSLAEIKDALAAIEEFQRAADRNQASNAQNPSYISSLSSIWRNYRDYQAGLPVSLEINYQNADFRNHEVAEKLAELKAELLKLTLPRYVGAPEGTAAGAEENVLDFLKRMEEEARERQDPAAGYRIRRARDTLMRGNSFSGQDMTGLNAYVSGQNQEEAGQFGLAVISYQEALKSGSDLVPAKLIGERLEAIREAHPQEYEKGMERFLDPPPSRYPDDFFRRPPFPEARGQNPAPSLLIPAPKDGDREAPASKEERKK